MKNRIRVELFRQKRVSILGTSLVVLLFSSCSGVKGFLAIDDARSDKRPIQNPFGNFYAGKSEKEASRPLVVRSKQGERSLEFEIPTDQSEQADWEIPAEISSFAGTNGTDERKGQKYTGKRPSVADREILSSIPKEKPDSAAARREIEAELGLKETAEVQTEGSSSYLGRLDQVKQLFRESRYEASLLEVEDMLQEYPMDPKLHEMRGTLLDRLGHYDLAKQSWGQALELKPDNESLRRYLEKKEGRIPASTKSDVTGGISR